MKQKNYYLIWCILFIFLMIPFQFGCDKAEDELQLPETEEQVVGNEQGSTHSTPPPLPKIDPFGNPINPLDITNSDNLKGKKVPKGKKPHISHIKLTEGNLLLSNLDSWDTDIAHTIYLDGSSQDFYTLHYYKRNGGDWISSDWQHHPDWLGPINWATYKWDVSFRKGDVIETYAQTFKGKNWNANGGYFEAWGPTYTIEDAEGSIWDGFADWVMVELMNYVVDGTFNGFGIPWVQIVGWFSGGLYCDIATVVVIDQDGNPLHARTGPVDNFLGVSTVDDAERSLGTKAVICKEPDGPESYDDNLYGREVLVDFSPYDNEDYWGVNKHMPVITVTYNTNGTTTVDYPNKPPTGEITKIFPNPAIQGIGNEIEFWADASDTDGTISEYRWYSDKNGCFLCSLDPHVFYSQTTPLQIGDHLITLIVVDDQGAESVPDSATLTIIEEPPLTDPRDGQVYQTVRIGTQTWMAENLNYSCSGSYVYNNFSSNGEIYGRLYNWNVAMTAAPAGWHLPTKAEWTTLMNYLGGDGVAGGKMKETGTAHWVSPNKGATNESGFSGLPGGLRYDSGLFHFSGSIAYFWSATESSSSNAWSCSLFYYHPCVEKGHTIKDYAFSVRCVKD
ncbi:MAG: fibrobacter succinogenes major paralogous domain-containing protein [Bacteroidales bacterium]|nr:fibrobacter succinogenes major paralogous domain-containing protein [Bacteroidales bacterium]